MPKSLSRTSSISSVSTDDSHSVFVDGLIRRTRKRFSHDQLTMLEALYYQTQHPSRSQREEIACKGNMEIKSVTIWFQNRRQSRRKDIAITSHDNPNQPEGTVVPHEFMAGVSLDTLEPSSHRATAFYRSGSSHGTGRSSSPTSSLFSSSATQRFTRPDCPSHRPSLDRVASRSELRVQSPTTPTRESSPRNSNCHRVDGDRPIWELMGASPLAPNNSPLAKDLVEFGKKRSLEWACAKHRIRHKADPSAHEEADCADLSKGADTDIETEDEDMEAITPDGSISILPSEAGSSPGITNHRMKQITLSSPPHSGGDKIALPSIVVQDDETMDAALALCGLGSVTRSHSSS